MVILAERFRRDRPLATDTRAERRLAAVVAADVAGYSRFVGADEEGTHARLRAHFRELIEPKIAEHHGRVVKNTGNGFLAEFASVVDAVRCAIEVQRAVAERNAPTASEKRIEFRIGINLGDVIHYGVCRQRQRTSGLSRIQRCGADLLESRSGAVRAVWGQGQYRPSGLYATDAECDECR
jgi:class 3 adenylate cyclase